MTDISIVVKYLSDRSRHVVRIDSKASIERLRGEIHRATAVPAERQRLLYSGKVLKDGKTLQDYNIKDGKMLTMLAKPIVTKKEEAVLDDALESLELDVEMEASKVAALAVQRSRDAKEMEELGVTPLLTQLHTENPAFACVPKEKHDDLIRTLREDAVALRRVKGSGSSSASAKGQLSEVYRAFAAKT
eukprot:g2223.t1